MTLDGLRAPVRRWGPQMLRRSTTRSTYLVRLEASGAFVGTVQASCMEEALGAACVLATRSGQRPQRLDVRPAQRGRA